MIKKHGHIHKWEVVGIEYKCRDCHKISKLIDVIMEKRDAKIDDEQSWEKNTIADVVYGKKGKIKKFVNEREMKDVKQ